MKANWIIALLAVCVLVPASPASALLIAHWGFDQNPGDSVAVASAGGVDGNLFGDAAFVPGGVSGNAISVSRNGGGYVSMGTNFGLSGTFSVAAWVKTAPGYQTADAIMVSKHTGGSSNGYFLGMNTSAGFGQTDKAYFYPSASFGQEAISTTNVNDGDWHLIVGVFDSGTARMYVDDGPAEDMTGPGLSIVANAAPFLVGGVFNNNANVSRFDGLIDDVRLYDEALTQSQIEALIPEPASLALLGVGGLAILVRRKRFTG